jgi:hypothetical protein
MGGRLHEPGDRVGEGRPVGDLPRRHDWSPTLPRAAPVVPGAPEPHRRPGSRPRRQWRDHRGLVHSDGLSGDRRRGVGAAVPRRPRPVRLRAVRGRDARQRDGFQRGARHLAGRQVEPLRGHRGRARAGPGGDRRGRGPRPPGRTRRHGPCGRRRPGGGLRHRNGPSVRRVGHLGVHQSHPPA